MKRIYIAGAIQGKDIIETLKEIERARSLNIRVWSSSFLKSKLKVSYE